MRREQGKNTYIKVLDHMPEHPKIDGLSDRAFRVLIESWCWCNRQLSDGHIPIKLWRKRSTPKVTKELEAEGLIHVHDDHVEMHDYLDHQTSKAQVEHIREVRKTTGSKGGRPKPNPNQNGTNLVSKPEAKHNPEDRRQKKEKSGAHAHAPAHTRGTPRTPADWNTTSYSAQANELIKHYRHLHHDNRIPSHTISKIGRETDRLLAEGFPHTHIKLGLARLHRRQLGAAMLAEMVHDVTRDPDRIQYLDEHGVPLIPATDIPDDAIHPDQILGNDYWTPEPPPLEIDEGPHDGRLEWFRQQHATHHTERHAQARRVLAHRAEKTPAA